MEPLLILCRYGSVAWERGRLLGSNGFTFQKTKYGISLSISAMVRENWDPKKQHRANLKTKPPAVIITCFLWNWGSHWSHCKILDFSPSVHCSDSRNWWLTCELGGDSGPADVFLECSVECECLSQPSWEAWQKNRVHHILTGISWNSASDTGSRCEQPCPPKQESWVKCYCLSLSR